MGDPDELKLVELAVTIGITGCLVWHPLEIERVRKELQTCALEPELIREEVIKYVRAGGVVHQVKESRPERGHRVYYYKVILPVPGLFKKGLFVEMELTDPDPDVPTATVNAHEQK